MPETYDRLHPFMASVTERYSLCKPGSSKNVVHIALDLTGSNLTYEVGDSIAILPENDPDLVKQILQALRLSGNAPIVEPKTEQPTILNDFLTKQANLHDCTKKFLYELSIRQPDRTKRIALESLLQESHGEELKSFQQGNDLLDVLSANEEAVWTPQTFAALLKPMMPRFYSIASSQKVVGQAVHLTVVMQEWESKGRRRFGVCTQFLCNLIPLGTPLVPIYPHPNRGFTLPGNPDAPIIMVGPGTGVAPFRGFLQERAFLNARGKNWLFFGECHRAHHFFYEDYWTSLEQAGKLRLDTAFSRDQPEKIYVQNRMMEHAEELYAWLEEGAYFYVCGDASRMSKDVDAALHRIVEEQGNHSKAEAIDYIKMLRKTKRYLKDVY